MDKSEIRAALTGIIPTLSTPYNQDGSIDYDGVRALIDFVIDAGATSVVLTVGDSHYIAMSDDEIGELTRVTVRHTAGRACVVAADREYDTKQSVAFAKACREWGVDVLMVKPPDWAASTTVESLVAHYTQVGKHMPVMLVTNVFVPRGEAFGLEVVRRLLESNANVVSVKDDMCGSFARKLSLLAAEHWAVWAGGLKENHINMAPFGAQGYLSTFVMFKPQVAHRYWNAWVAGDMADAVRVIDEVEYPWWSMIEGLTGGFNAGIHGTLEVFGIAQRWRPRPYHSMTDAEMDALASWYREQGLL